MANVAFLAATYGVQLTVGRATTTGAIAADSTNIVSNVSPLALPVSSTAYYISALPTMADAEDYVNLNGFAIDTPGAGTFYYTIWMSSTTSHNYADITALLSVLIIQV
jgi:hypothetical protein